MDYDNNFKLSSSGKKYNGIDDDQESIPSVGMKKELSQDFTNMVLSGINQANRVGTPTITRANVPSQRPFFCGVCS